MNSLLVSLAIPTYNQASGLPQTGGLANNFDQNVRLARRVANSAGEEYRRNSSSLRDALLEPRLAVIR
jgi:hypothetical protein